MLGRLVNCRQCSTDLPDGSAYCNLCGADQSAGRPRDPAPPPSAEEPLWSGSYCLRAALHVWIAWGVWGALVVLGYLGLVTTRSSPVSLLVGALAVLPGAWFLGKALLRRWSLRYRLTTHRLFTDRGLLRRQHDELELIRVDDISVRQNLLQRWLGVGTVTVVSTDSSNPRLEIEGILAPLALKERIRTQVRALRSRTTFLETL